MEIRVYFDEYGNKPFTECANSFKSLKKTYNDVKFVYTLREFDLVKYDLKSHVSKTQDIINKLNVSGINKDEFVISFLHDKTGNVNSNQSCKMLFELTKKFGEYNIGIEAGDITWNVEQIAKSNARLNHIADEIKSKNLSPVENLMYAYNIITKLPYKKENPTDSVYLSREVFGVLNSDKIVCVGYVELFRELISRLNMEQNVKCFKNHVNLIGKRTELHENCIIYIKDKKYGIDGYYYFDPTADSVTKDNVHNKLLHFLLPIDKIASLNHIVACAQYLDGEQVKYTTGRYNNINSYKRPYYESYSSVYSQGATLTEQFLDFMQKDEHILQMLNKHFGKYTIKDLYNADKKVVWSILKKRSPSINIVKMLDIIKNVQTKMHPTITKNETLQRVEKIYDTNRVICKSSFKPCTTVCFSKYQYNILKQLQKEKKFMFEDEKTK